jgi:hypothetical protein
MALTPATLRLDAQGQACGQSHISRGKTCRKRGSFPTGKAIAAGLTAGAIGAALLNKGSRRAILGAPGATSRAARRAVTEVVHRATAPKPSMKLTGAALNAMRPPSKTQRLRTAARNANQEAERAISKAAQAEIERAGAVGNAMYAAGKATRASLRSGMRTHNLSVERLRRRYEPGYRKPRRDSYIQHYAPVQLQPPTRRFDAVVFTDKKLHAAVRAEARRKFKVYPSAYANAWMVKEYKNRGGSFRGDSLDTWFKEKWVRMSSSGRILGPCGDRTEGEGKPKCLPAAKAQGLTAAQRRTLVARKRRNDPAKNRSGAPVMVSSKTDVWAAGFDTEDGKKYSKVVTNPDTGRKNRIRYGAKGYKIAPGTDKGDRYCARSFGDMKSHGKNCAGADRNTPLCLSRTKWKCSGKTSRRS